MRKVAGNGDPYEKSVVPVPISTDDELGSQTDSAKSDNHRVSALAQVENEKRLALIKAWEDNEKSKVDNNAYKKLSAVDAWENAKRASVEIELRQIEEEIENKKAEYEAKMKNDMALVRRAAEEKRALVEAERGRHFLMVEEAAAQGTIPNKICACFS